MRTSRFFLALVLVINSLNLLAAEVGEVSYLTGTMVAINADGNQRLMAEKSLFKMGDVLTTLVNTHARVLLKDGTQLVLRPNTSVNIDNVYYDEVQPEKDSFAISLVKGGMRAVTGLISKRNREKIQFMTTTATVGIRGTHFGMQLCNDDCLDYNTVGGGELKNGLYADMSDGMIVLSNLAGELELNPGDLAYVADQNSAPVIVDENSGHKVVVPLSVMFDSNAQVWSDGIKCNACTVR